MTLPVSTVVAYACQIARAPGYTQQAGNMLLALLQSLARQHDFDIIRKDVSFPLVPGTLNNAYPVPSDYLRAKQIYYQIQGQPFEMEQMSYETYTVQYQGPDTDNYPERFASDPSRLDAFGNSQVAGQGVIFPYPAPQQSIPARLVYYSMPADVDPTSTTAIPWFPNSRYLITQLASELMMFTDDDRLIAFQKRADDILRNELQLIQDDEGYAQTVRLDPNTFRVGGSLKNTKTLPL